MSTGKEIAMRRLCLLALVCLSVPASAQTLTEARKLLQKGNYSEAADAYRELLKKNADPAASIGLALALDAEGKYDEALAVVESSLKEQPGHADLLAQHADRLYRRGHWDDAETIAKKALDRNEDQFLARWVLGRITRDRGDWEGAVEKFRWFVKAYNRIDKVSPEDLLLIGQAVCEYARYHHLEDQFTFVLNEVYGEAIKEDPLLWQAEFLKAHLLIEKHNKQDGAKAWERALRINPQAAEVKALQARYNLDTYEIEEAERFADEALAINPNLREALAVKIDFHLTGNQDELARKELAKLTHQLPRDELAWAQYAAWAHQARKPEEIAKAIKTVESFNSKPYVFYTEFAERLDRRKFYRESETYFKKAADMQPKLPSALVGLAHLYMRMGDEAKARDYFNRGFEADPFDVRVSNSIKVLDHLKKYKTEATANYILRYDPKHDQVFANFLKKELEDIHKEFSEKFDFKPKEPFLFEVFNRHEMFSGRIAALPDLHTIGACTGRMVAMVSPRDKDRAFGRHMNWKRVVRHEVVHLFNLEQTNFQIPHWFTEGLAVSLEGTGAPPSWDVLLARKVRDNDLMNLDNILLGFIRFRTPDQFQQAYLQSLLYVEYLEKTHGPKSIGKLLAAFAEGLDNDAALMKAIQTSKADFEKGYRGFLEDRVKDMRIPSVRKVRTLKELKEANAKMPDDHDTAAELAEAYIRTSKFREAEKLVDAVLNAKPNHPLATYVKADLLLRDKNPELAVRLLKASMDADPTEPKVIKLLAALQEKLKNVSEAAEALEVGRKLEPYEVFYLQKLIKIYRAENKKDKVIDILRDVARLDYDSLDARRALAVHYQQKEDYAMAEKYARQALDIVVDDMEIQEILLEALEEQKKDKELAEFKKLFGQE
jgi:tetratricopeptide (TPR) repeat protein